MVSGSVTTLVLVHTTCIKSTVSFPVQTLSSHFTKIWLHVTVPVSGLSMYVFPPLPFLHYSVPKLMPISLCRSFVWLKSRRPRMSADRTSSSSVYQTSNSLYPIGWPSRGPLSWPTVPALSRCALFGLGIGVYTDNVICYKSQYMLSL